MNAAPDSASAGTAQVMLAVHLPGPVIPAWQALLLSSLATMPELRVVSIAEAPSSPLPVKLPAAVRLGDGLITRLSHTPLPDALASVRWRQRLPELAVLPATARCDVLIDLAGAHATRQAMAGPPPCGTWRYRFESTDHSGATDVCARETLMGNGATTYCVCAEGWLGDHPPAPFFERGTLGWTREAQVDTHSLSISQNRNEVLWSAATLLPQILGAAARLGTLSCAPQRVPAASSAAQADRNGHGSMIKARDRQVRLLSPAASQALLPRYAARAIRALLRRVFWREQWVLLWGPNQGFSAFEAPPCHRLDPPRDRFWADPHMLMLGEDLHMFVEELPFATGRGRIALLTRSSDGRWSEPATVLQEPHHLSYPFVFEWEGRVYMIPESATAEEVRLYRCGGTLQDWRLERVLLRGIRAADATLVEHDGRWWMFATVAHFAWTLPTYELHIFSSNSPVGGDWHPHPANPVSIRADRARPAGAFIRHDGRLLRPAQDCSQGYGRAIRLMEVLELSERAYAEREVAGLSPDALRGLRGTHTLAVAGGLRVQDGLVLQPRFNFFASRPRQ